MFIKISIAMSNRKMMQISFDDYMDIIGGALSGLTGGTMLGFSYGPTGGVIGAILGSLITGYDAYRTVCKNYSTSGTGKMPEGH